jgi:hypothetical protein
MPITHKRHPAHKIYPYRLRHLAIERANHVWAMDITYLPMQRGFLYLAAVMDWATRRVLSWRVSNTLSADFCIEAVEEAIEHYGKPEIFNTDQGTQFTSDAFTTMLHDHGVAISMDGRVGATTSSWNACGARSSTKRCICMPTRVSAAPKPASVDISSSTTVDGRTPRSATKHPTRHISRNTQYKTQHDRLPSCPRATGPRLVRHRREVTYKTRESVSANRASSEWQFDSKLSAVQIE